MTDHRVTGGRATAAGGLAIAVALVLATGGGCAKRQPTPARPPPTTPTMQRPTMEMDPDRRAADVRRQAEAFAALSKNMPGMSPAENRQLQQQAFTQLSALLPSLGGPDAGGIFEHQVSVVNDTRTQLAGSSPNLVTDPIVDNGLRAVRNALTELAHVAYYDQPQIGQAVDQLSARVDELDTYPGPTHPLAVAATVQQASQAISAMAEVLAGRTVVGVGPSTVPATEPAGATGVSPATAPSTEPSAAPASAPATEPAAPTPPSVPPATAPATTETPAPGATAPAATPTETPAAPAPNTPAPAPPPPPPPPPGDLNK